MKKLFGRFFFSVKRINDKDIDDLIIKLYEEISDGKGSRLRLDFIDYKTADETEDFSDVTLKIYYKNRETLK